MGQTSPRRAGQPARYCRVLAKAWSTCVLVGAAWLQGAAIPQFESQVLPVFQQHCTACHGDAATQGDLDLRSREAALRGGTSGPAVIAGDSAGSLLVAKLVSGSMPMGGERLAPSEIEVIRHWIDEGLFASNAARAVTERDVLPVFQMRCVTCHGKRRKEAGLDLRTRASRLRGGESGPAVIPGDPDGSLALQRVLAGEMPPPHMLMEFNVRPPGSKEVETLKAWIAGGARPDPRSQAEHGSLVSDEDRSFWSFRPPERPALPEVSDAGSVFNPIDTFIAARLQQEGLGYAPEASPETLLRRVYLDLIGLPPSTDEATRFLNDGRPDAYEHLVDTLLDSEHYGERWAQVWLDLAGYADSEGIIDEDRIREHAWRYRDYVVRALNSDKPYDEFLTEQIAGDELWDYRNLDEVTQQTVDRLAATGFLRMASDPTYSFANASLGEKLTVVADQLEILSSSVLGLTVGCARCHDHKYDPIPQRDYYRLSAVLHTAYDPYDWVDPTERLLDVALEGERRTASDQNDPIEAKIEGLESAWTARKDEFRRKAVKALAAELPESVSQDLLRVLDTPRSERDEIQKYLAAKFRDILEIRDGELTQRFPEFGEEAKRFQESVGALKKTLVPKPRIRAAYDMGGEPSAVYLLRRGEPQSVGERVYPGSPEVFDKAIEPLSVHSTRPAETSGNRTALARWLTQTDHPLTSRVIVNRIWLNYFGRGIVSTPENFGKTGAPPSHPRLLDWLATELVRSGWSLKHLHRLIVTSRTYRQSSRIPDAARARDPQNVLLSRMPLRRMPAEILYDSILRSGDRLDSTQFGPPTGVEVLPGGETVAETTQGGWRRAVYTLRRRSTPVTLMDTHDLPQLSPNCTERSRSTVATQALQLENGTLARSVAQYLAGRLVDRFPDDTVQWVEQLYLRLYARRPTGDETTAALRDLTRLRGEWYAQLGEQDDPAPRELTSNWRALGSLAHAMLSSNEFAFID